MATRKSPIELQRHNINLYKGDFDRLNTLFPQIGASRAIRQIIRLKINQIEAKAAPRLEVADDSIEV